MSVFTKIGWFAPGYGGCVARQHVDGAGDCVRARRSCVHCYQQRGFRADGATTHRAACRPVLRRHLVRQQSTSVWKHRRKMPTFDLRRRSRIRAVQRACRRRSDDSHTPVIATSQTRPSVTLAANKQGN